ncbi:MAG: methyltransferase domain-containing protein [Myxococcota bacterium]|nr:methyltransferase domain-containing protein [Myxococcota bacterium]
MTSIFEAARHGRALAHALDAFAVVPLLRTGLRLGLFEALRTPQSAAALADRLGLEADLVSAWARNLHAQGWLQKKGDAYRLAPATNWLVDAPEAPSLHALLDHAVDTMAARLGALPELLKGAERPSFGSVEEAHRMAAITRLVEPRALRVLEQIPGVRHPQRVLDIGCGRGDYLAGLLKRYRDAMGVGIEIEPVVAEEARRRLAEADVTRRAEVRVGDFRTMELPRGTFDLILLNHNLHYFAPGERVALLRRAKSRLVETGVIAVQTLVLTEGILPSLFGLQAGAALFDLVLRTQRNLHGLPEAADVHQALADAGFGTTGEVAVVPGGAVRFIWGTSARVADAKDGA